MKFTMYLIISFNYDEFGKQSGLIIPDPRVLISLLIQGLSDGSVFHEERCLTCLTHLMFYAVRWQPKYTEHWKNEFQFRIPDT